jgi:1,4-alpha-glucan branching enzyme
LTTLEKEIDRASDGPAINLEPGSWGSGKDFRVWEHGEAGELVQQGKGAQYAVLAHLTNQSAHGSALGRNATNDHLASELLLGLASDWGFMITKDSAADYARRRSHEHFQRVADLLRSDHHPKTQSRDNSMQEGCAPDTRLPFVDARYCTRT